MTYEALELTVVTTCGGALDTGAVFFRIAAMIVGSEFLNTWAIAVAIPFEREVDAAVEAAVTTTEVTDDEGDEVGAAETNPAVRLLLVESRGTMWNLSKPKNNAVKISKNCR